MVETYTVKVDNNGTEMWYQNNELHRKNGPAITDADGNKYWYQNNELHRKTVQQLLMQMVINTGTKIMNFIERTVQQLFI